MNYFNQLGLAMNQRFVSPLTTAKLQDKCIQAAYLAVPVIVIGVLRTIDKHYQEDEADENELDE